MLVLSRKANESIVIADVIRIVVIEVRGDKVRLGIEAPKDVDVDRYEIWVQKQSATGAGQVDVAEGSVGVTEGQPAQCSSDSGDRVHKCCGKPACGRSEKPEAGSAAAG